MFVILIPPHFRELHNHPLSTITPKTYPYMVNSWISIFSHPLLLISLHFLGLPNYLHSQNIPILVNSWISIFSHLFLASLSCCAPSMCHKYCVYSFISAMSVLDYNRSYIRMRIKLSRPPMHPSRIKYPNWRIPRVNFLLGNVWTLLSHVSIWHTDLSS